MATKVSEDKLDDIFGALANTTRRAILAQLVRGASSVGELAEPFDMTLPAISKHIKVLEKAGLITRTRQAQLRPCSLRPAALKHVSSWAEQYRPVWEGRFDRMDDYMRHLKKGKGKRDGR